MGAYGHLYHPAAIAGLDDIDPAPGGMNTHAEALEVVVPDNALALLADLCLPFISSGVHQERRPVRRHW